MAGREIEIRRIAGALGAKVSGVDLALPLAESQVAALRRAWLEHLVLFFRDQPLTPAQFMAFAGRFGEPVDYPYLKGLDGFPKITEVKKLEHERVNFGGVWHSDTAYLECPPMAYPQLAGLPECPLITPVIKLEHERVNFGGIWHSDTTYLENPPRGSMLYAVEILPYVGGVGDVNFDVEPLACVEIVSASRPVSLRSDRGVEFQISCVTNGRFQRTEREWVTYPPLSDIRLCTAVRHSGQDQLVSSMRRVHGWGSVSRDAAL